MPLFSCLNGAVLVTIAVFISVIQDAEAHVLRTQRPAHEAPSKPEGGIELARPHPDYDHAAYSKSWHDEWEPGDYPSWKVTNPHAYRILRHMHPIVPGPQILNYCISNVFPTFSHAYVAMIICMAIVFGLCWLVAGRIRLCFRGSVHEGAASASLVRRPNLDSLDGLRAVLIGYIVLFHLRNYLPPWLYPYFSAGHWAVQFFFVLSGFVSCHAMQGQFVTFDLQRTAKFLVRRMARLCPAYFASLLWLGGLALFGLYAALPFLAWPVAAMLGQTLLPVKVCGDVDPSSWTQNSLAFGANPMGWFVSCIMMCSVCFPLLYNNLCARSSGRGTFFVLLLVLMTRSLPTLAELLLGHAPESMDEAVYDWRWTNSFNVYAFAPLRVLEFAGGVLTAHLCSQLPPEVQAWSGWAWTFDASLVLVWLAKERLFAMYPAGPAFGDYMISGIFCLTCAAARGVSEHARQCEEPECILTGGLLVRLLSLRPLVWLAEYSYGAFIYEEPAFSSLNHFPMADYIPEEHKWWVLALTTWVAGALSLHLLELPVKRMFERLINSDGLSRGKEALHT